MDWGDRYVWLEGKVVNTFTTNYGLAVTLKITAMHDNGIAVKGKDEEGNKYDGRAQVGDEVNIGTQAAALNGKVTEDDVGRTLHIAFEGWSESKGGRNFRAFSVIPLDDREPAAASSVPDESDGPESEDTHDYPDVGGDSDLPF